MKITEFEDHQAVNMLFSEARFARMDGVASRLCTRLETLSRALPEGGDRELASLALADAQDLIADLRTGQPTGGHVEHKE